MIQDEEIAHLWRKEKKAWDDMDIDGIVETIRDSQGFGIRGRDWRYTSYHSEEHMRTAFPAWLNKMEYLIHTDYGLNTWSDGEIGIAWGFYTEEFKHVGEAPETVRIKFTSTYKRVDDSWKLIMSHKDMQDFNPDGSFVKSSQ